MTNQTDHVPVMRCVISAFVFLRRNMIWLYLAGSIYVIASIASNLLAIYFSTASGTVGLGMMLTILIMVMMVVLFAAYLRRGLGITSSGMFGLQLGTDELRLFLTMFAIGAITTFIIFIGAIASVLALSTIIASVVDPAIIEAEPASAFSRSGTTGLIAAVLLGLAVGALGLYTVARFSPAYSAVIAERRIVVFEAAVWSKGQGWRMVLAILLTGLPFYLLLAPGMLQYGRFVLSFLQSTGDAQMVMPTADDLRPFIWFFVLRAFLWPATTGAMSGLYVTFYRGLRASGEKHGT